MENEKGRRLKKYSRERDENLPPRRITNRSIEIILAPIIGGLGTLFGPILGAAILTLLSEGVTEGLRLAGWEVPGLKQIFYGIVLGLSIVFMPNGVWPGIARRLKLGRAVSSAASIESKGATGAVSDSEGATGAASDADRRRSAAGAADQAPRNDPAQAKVGDGHA